MENGARGVKLQLSGRLGGSEMARCEKGMEGSIPLSTLRCKVEYGFAEASTPQGNIGIKAWVNQGDYLTGEIADATDASVGPAQRRRGPRRGPGGGGGDRGPRQG
jgi:small subunit ribosomal protein S3